MTVEWTELEKAYWAAITDGETCISWRHTPMVSLNTTDLLLAQFLSSEYQVSCTSRLNYNNRRDSYSVTLCSKNCIDFLEKVYPYLLIKDRQAKVVLTGSSNLHTELLSLNKRSVNHELREPKKLIWTEKTFSYFAGLVDGEGTISFFCKRTNLSTILRLRIKMCDSGSISPLAERYNLTVYKEDRSHLLHRDAYYVQFYSQNLQEFLTNIYPYLRLKKPQAELVLNCGPSREERLLVVEQLRILNKRGKQNCNLVSFPGNSTAACAESAQHS